MSISDPWGGKHATYAYMPNTHTVPASRGAATPVARRAVAAFTAAGRCMHFREGWQGVAGGTHPLALAVGRAGLAVALLRRAAGVAGAGGRGDLEVGRLQAGREGGESGQRGGCQSLERVAGTRFLCLVGHYLMRLG